MSNLNVFKNVTNEELLEIYKDILGSKELGIGPRSLDPYAREIREKCHFDVFSEATNFVIKLFYEEVASRFFKRMIL